VLQLYPLHTSLVNSLGIIGCQSFVAEGKRKTKSRFKEDVSCQGTGGGERDEERGVAAK
jgi:hypothetical protein